MLKSQHFIHTREANFLLNTCFLTIFYNNALFHTHRCDIFAMVYFCNRSLVWPHQPKGIKLNQTSAKEMIAESADGP